MPGLAKTVTELLGARDLYAALGVDQDASAEKIKRGYYKQALKHHPDRVVDKEAKELATRRFQALSAAYKVLADEEKKKVYDETGEVDEDDDDFDGKDRDWDKYWRLLFKKVTTEDIERFAKEYRHSEEEVKDIKQAYLNGNGDLSFILDSVPCSSDDDTERFHDIISQMVKSGEVPTKIKFKALTAKQLKLRKRKTEKEAEEAKEMAKEIGLSSGATSDLESMIAKRMEERGRQADKYLDALAEKYGKPKKGKKK